jgi:hypothetical protein
MPIIPASQEIQVKELRFECSLDTKHKTPPQKMTKAKRVRDMVHMVKYLPRKHEALSSILVLPSGKNLLCFYNFR